MGCQPQAGQRCVQHGVVAVGECLHAQRLGLEQLRLRAEPGVEHVAFADRLPVEDQFKYGIEVDKLIPKNMEEFRSKMAEHKEQGYPEMRRPITVFILVNVEGIHEHKIVDKSGAWYAYQGDKIGQGKDNSREFLRANPALAREIENKVRVAVGLPELPPAAASTPAPAEA